MNQMDELNRWRESRAMLVARLDKMHEEGDRWLTVASVHALMNDCDMLAAMAMPVAVQPQEQTP